MVQIYGPDGPARWTGPQFYGVKFSFETRRVICAIDLPANIVLEQYSHVFLVFRCQKDGSDKWQIFRTIPDNATSITIYNLLANQTYRFKILSNRSTTHHSSKEMIAVTKGIFRPLKKFVVITSRQFLKYCDTCSCCQGQPEYKHT